MVVAIVHCISLTILAKFEASSIDDACLQYIHSHPEYECETLAEFGREFPLLSQALLTIPLN